MNYDVNMTCFSLLSGSIEKYLLVHSILLFSFFFFALIV